jgi:hypothetical protein
MAVWKHQYSKLHRGLHAERGRIAGGQLHKFGESWDIQRCARDSTDMGCDEWMDIHQFTLFDDECCTCQ